MIIKVNDNDEEVIEVESLPSFLSFVDTGNGKGVLYPHSLSIVSGMYSFTIKAHDEFSSISSKILWKIKPDPPIRVVDFDSDFLD